jgi:hypothetical protein
MKFILLHEGKNDEGIRGFFTEVWELYVKVRRIIQGYNFWRIETVITDDDEPVSYGSQYDQERGI